MEIINENEVCKYLGIPNIPKKKWDGKSSFKRGVGVVTLMTGTNAYVVVAFDEEKDTECRVVKVFTMEQFNSKVEDVFVVPDYMDTNVETMDLDESSKQAAKALVDEAKELESIDDDSTKVELPENEYYFDNIHDDDEAQAFIKSYNQTNKIRGKVPTTHEAIVMRLSVIYSEINNKQNKSTNRRKKK